MVLNGSPVLPVSMVSAVVCHVTHAVVRRELMVTAGYIMFLKSHLFGAGAFPIVFSSVSHLLASGLFCASESCSVR